MTKEISPNLSDCKFIKIQTNEKSPCSVKDEKTGKGIDWNELVVDMFVANLFLKDGWNVGLVAGNGIIVVDADKPDSVDYCDNNLPITYTEKTCSDGRHYVYKCNDEIKNTLIPNDMGEIRVNREYVVIAPSRAKSKLTGKIEDYVVLKDISLSIITKDQLNKLVEHFSSSIDKREDLTKIEQKKVNKDFMDKEVIPNLNSYMKDLVLHIKTKDELRLLGFPSRSERDMKIVTYLLNRGLGEYILSVFKIYPCGDKYLEHPSGDKYLDKTIKDAIEFLGIRTKGEMELEFDIESSNVTWLKRKLDEYLQKIIGIHDNTNLFKERLITTLAYRIKISQKTLEKRIKELEEQSQVRVTLSMMDISQKTNIPIEYWVDPLLPKGAILLIGSKPGVGKSLLVQSMITSFLTTGSFLSYQLKGDPKFLLYSVDDSSENILQTRSVHLLNGLKSSNPGLDVGRLDNFRVSLNFNPHRLQKEIEFCSGYDVIVIDSLRRVLSGSENDSEITNQFFNDFLKPIKEMGKTIIILHHIKKGNLDELGDDDLLDIFRGSGDILAQIDLSFILRGNNNPNSTIDIDVKSCSLRLGKNRLGLLFRGPKGNIVDDICYDVIRDVTKVQTFFKPVDVSEVLTPREMRQSFIREVLQKRGTMGTQSLVTEVVGKYRCSRISVQKDLEEMVKGRLIFKEKYGEYSVKNVKEEM